MTDRSHLEGSQQRTVWQYHGSDEDFRPRQQRALSNSNSLTFSSSSNTLSFPASPSTAGIHPTAAAFYGASESINSAGAINPNPNALSNPPLILPFLEADAGSASSSADIQQVVGYLWSTQQKPAATLPAPVRRSHSAPPVKRTPATSSLSQSASYAPLHRPAQSGSKGNASSLSNIPVIPQRNGQQRSADASLGNLTDVMEPRKASAKRRGKSAARKAEIMNHLNPTEASFRAASPTRANSSLSNPVWWTQNALFQRSHKKSAQEPMDWGPVVFMLKSSHLYMQKHAVAIVATLSLNQENHAIMIESRLIPPLIRLSNSSDVSVRKDAQQALAHLATNSEAHEHLLKSDGLEFLIRSLSDADTDLRKLSLEAIRKMIVTHEYCEIIAQSEVMPIILQAVRCKYPELRRLASAALREIVATKSIVPRMIYRGILKEFPSLLKSKDAVVRTDSCAALGLILDDGDGIDHAVECELHLIVMSLVSSCSRDGRDDPAFVISLGTLEKFCSIPGIVEQLMEQNIHNIVVDAIKSRNMEVQKQGVDLLSSITCSHAYCAKLVADEKTLTAVLNLGFSNHKAMKKGVALIIRRLVKANHGNILLQKNAISLLILLSKVFDYDVQSDVAIGLAGIMQLDGVEEDEKPFIFSKLVKIGVTEAISALCDIDAREIKVALSKALCSMCEYVQEFEKSIQLLVSSLLKLAAINDREVNNMIVRSFYMLSYTSVNIRPMCDQGVIAYLRKVNANRDVSAEYNEDIFRALENIAKEIDSRK